MRSLVTLACVVVLAGCGSTTGAEESPETTLTVLAAASLSEPFTELETTYEQQHPRVDVRLTFDSSATLAQQVVEGAPADVLATADAPTMDRAANAGATAATPQVFATNTMVLAVPADNPASVERLDDLERDDVDYVTCAPSAPCGALAQSLLDRNGVEAEPVSYEVDVKAVLTKVELDEADAGLVYASDAVSAGAAVRTFEVPGSSEAVNDYLVATLGRSEQAEAAKAWVDLVLSGQGRDVLAAAGFATP